MLNTKFKPWPSYSPEEIEAVEKVLSSGRVNYWTGDQTKLFEKEFAKWCGVSHAIALSNGTVALELALRVLGIGQDDEVIVTSRTFIASISCVAMVGATPVFADVDPISGNLSAETIKSKITDKTKAVICVHLAGWPCDMDPIMELANKHGLKVIEDCAQAHGASYKGRSVGSIGHVGAWSFCQDKIMTTGGEGGMVTTNDESLWRAMWSYKDHGKSYEAVYERKHPPGFRWLHESFGTNWRMLEIQAAIGRIQLQSMPDWTTKRRFNASKLVAAFHSFSGVDGPIRLPKFGCTFCSVGCGAGGTLTCNTGCVHGHYKFYAYVRGQNLSPGWSRDRIIEAINEKGVPCFQGSCSEVYLEKAFEGTGWRPAHRLNVARELGETSIMLLVHPTLTDDEISKTCSVIKQVMIQASKN